MGNEYRIQVLEGETRGLHSYLEENDVCYYLGEYTSHTSWDYSDTNSLIGNIKKDPSKRSTNPYEYRYKEPAIKKAAGLFRRQIKSEYLEKNITLVPIPPSKTKTHPEYDDRVLKICKYMVEGLLTPDVKELIQPIKDTEPTHHEETKPPPPILISNYKLVCEPNYRPRKYIFLVDDVLTTGSHFKACKNFLLKYFPEVEVIGVFVARRVFPPDEEDFL